MLHNEKHFEIQSTGNSFNPARFWEKKFISILSPVGKCGTIAVMLNLLND
jgi:hypothetical protein